MEKLRLEARPANAPELASKTLDEQYISEEQTERLSAAVAQAKLTPTQRRRFLLLESGLTIHDIAKAENCGYNAALESIQWAKKKIKKFLKK